MYILYSEATLSYTSATRAPTLTYKALLLDILNNALRSEYRVYRVILRLDDTETIRSPIYDP